jgi:hypothetical protein
MARAVAAPASYAALLPLYLELRTFWKRDPLLYVRQRFGVEPTWQQQQILEAIAPPGAKVSIRSGHGIGKTTAAAWALLWHLETHDFAKVPCTAPTSHQLRDILWGELSKWRRRADEGSAQRGDPPRFWLSRLFRLLTDSLTDPGAKDWGAFARTAKKENPEALQGFHGDALLYIIDEASGVDEAIFEAAEGALSTPGARVLMLGNPTRNTGTFAASHTHNRGDYSRALHFRSQDSPLVAPEYRERLVRKWGEGSNVVRVRADGDFPKQDDDVLISLELTEPCLTRERVKGEGPRVLGVDIASYGSDRTALVLRQGRVVERIAVFAQLDTMSSTGRIVEKAEAWGADLIAIDVIGMGRGPADRLREVRRQQGLPWTVVDVDVSRSAPARRRGEPRAKRLRDWLWLEVATWLRDEAPVFTWTSPEERQHAEDLAGELASVCYDLDSTGCIVVESKDDMKKRLGHSPDLGDALCASFASAKPWAGQVVIL